MTAGLGPIREYQSDQPSRQRFDRRFLCSTRQSKWEHSNGMAN